MINYFYGKKKLIFSVTHRVVVGELCVQLSDFDAQQGQLAARLVLVDAHLVLDVARAVRVPERVQRLHEVTVGRRRTGDHHRPAGGRGRAGGRWNSGTGGGRVGVGTATEGGRAGVGTATEGRRVGVGTATEGGRVFAQRQGGGRAKSRVLSARIYI